MTRERQLREFLSAWQFWMGIAYFGLVAVFIALYFVNSTATQTTIRQQRDEAIRVAEKRARVQTCIRSRPQLIKINAFVDAIRDFHEAAAENARATLGATPRSDPEYQTRLKNYLRVRRTLGPIARVHFSVPSKAECRALAGRE